MSNQNIDIKRIHATAANIAAGTQATIEKQWVFANDTKRIFVHEVGGAFTQFPNVTETILASGANDFTGDQSHGGYGITGIRDAAFVDTDTLAIDHAAGEWTFTSSVAQKFIGTNFSFEDANEPSNDMSIGKSDADEWFLATGISAGFTINGRAIKMQDANYTAGELTFSKSGETAWEISTGTTASETFKATSFRFMDPAVQDVFALTIDQTSSRAWEITSDSSATMLMTFDSITFEDQRYTTGDLVFDKTWVSAWEIKSSTTASTLAIDTFDLIFTTAGSGLPYGAFCGDEIAWAQASAAQNTWYTITDTDIASGVLNLATQSNGVLTLTTAGVYSVVYSASCSADALNTHVKVGISINDATPIACGMAHFDNLAAGDEVTIGGPALLTVTAGQTLRVKIQHTDAATPTLSVSHITLTAVMVGA